MISQQIVTKPYKLIALPLVSANTGTHYYHAYVKHEQFAEDPRHYVAAIRLIESDLKKIFEYVEPADTNSEAFSHRIHQLLFRCCVEIEAHFRNILSSNGFKPPEKRKQLDMRDFKLVEATHMLSKYVVRYPGWRGNIRWQPFKDWVNATPSWWNSYNGSKHNRSTNFEEANLGNLMGAIAGLIALYHSQYMDESFSSNDGTLAVEGGGYDANDHMQTAIMRQLRIAYPARSSYSMLYDFDWNEIKRTEEPVARYDYSQHL